MSQEVLDLESRPILNKEKIHPESEAIPSQKTWQQPSQGGGVRRQSRRVSASSTDQQCLTGTLLGLHGKVSAEAGMSSTTKGSLKLTGIATPWATGFGCAAQKGHGDEQSDVF